MTAYILSEDMYFVSGLAALLTGIGYKTCVLAHNEKIDQETFSQCSSCVVFIDMDKIGDYLVDVMSVDSKRVVKIFCIVERFSYHDVYHNSFVSLTSKQTGISDFTSLLKRASLSFNNKHSNNYSELSLQELKILHCFIKGYSLKEISYKLNISVKTISAHKIKALSKLGVRRVSSKSVSYVSGYISSVLGNAYCIN